MIGMFSRENFKAVLIKFGIAILLHSTILTQNLVGYGDGTWQGPYYMATEWEASIGRWAILLWDQLHFGLSAQPFNLLLLLLLLCIGTELAAMIMGMAGLNIANVICAMIILSDPIVDCSMSFSYTAVIYGWAFLFSMLCVAAIINASQSSSMWRYVGYIFAGVVFLTFTMAFYQGYLGCVILMLIGYVITRLFHEISVKSLGKLLVTSVIVGGVGTVSYELSVKLSLEILNAERASYYGYSSISAQTVLSNLPTQIKEVYKMFLHFLTSNGAGQHNLYSGMMMLVVMIAICILTVIGVMTSAQKVGNVILTMLLLVAIPIATCITTILAPASGISMQASGALVFANMLVGLLLAKTLQILKEQTWWKRLFRVLALAAATIYLWGSINASLVDQEAMREGKLAITSLAQSMLDRLIDENLYPQEDVTYAFVGSGPGNRMFYTTGFYYSANSYARCGAAGSKNYWDNHTWNGIYKYFVGIYMPMCTDSEYDLILQDESVAEMPIYPAAGSIMTVDNIVVIKVSN